MAYNFVFSERKPKTLYAVEFYTIMGCKVEVFDTLEEANIFYDRVATITKNNNFQNVRLMEVEKIQVNEAIYYLEKKLIKDLNEVEKWKKKTTKTLMKSRL